MYTWVIWQLDIYYLLSVSAVRLQQRTSLRPDNTGNFNARARRHFVSNTAFHPFNYIGQRVNTMHAFWRLMYACSKLSVVWIYLVFRVLYVNQSLLIAEIYQHFITSTTLTWLRPPRPSHGLRCEIVWIYLVFCVLYVNQSLLIAVIYQHSTTSTTLTWLRPPRPSHGLRCEIVWIYLVFCVLYVNQSLLIAEIYQHSITSTTFTWLRPPRPSHGLRCEIVWIYLVFCVLHVNQSLLIAEIYQHSITSTTLTWLRPPRHHVKLGIKYFPELTHCTHYDEVCILFICIQLSCGVCLIN